MLAKSIADLPCGQSEYPRGLGLDPTCGFHRFDQTSAIGFRLTLQRIHLRHIDRRRKSRT